MSDELDDLIQGFVEESREAFESIEKDLLGLEDNPDDLTQVDGIFRVLHTIKGTAGFMGLDEVNKLSHSLESIFDQVRKEEISMTPELMDQLLPAIDLLKLMVFELEASEKTDYPYAETMTLLAEILAGGAVRVYIEDKQAAPAAIGGGATPAAPTPPPAPVAEPAAPKAVVKIKYQEPEIDPDAAPISMELLQDFVVEADEHLETIEQFLLKLEESPNDDEAINEIFRATHSIKGTASYVNLGKVSALSHQMETCFDKVRKGVLAYSNEMADVILKGVDLLKSMVALIRMKEDSSILDIDDLLTLLEPFANAEQPAPAAGSPAAAAAPAKDPKMAAFANLAGQQIMTIKELGALIGENKAGQDELMVLNRSIKTLDNGARKLNLNAIFEQTQALEEMTVQILAEEKTEAELAPNFLSSISQLDMILGLFLDPAAAPAAPVMSAPAPVEAAPVVPVTPAPVEAAPVAAPAPAAKAAPKKEPTKVASPPADDEIKTMRIDAFRLDQFMNLIGELIIARNAFNHTLGELNTVNVKPEVMASIRSVEGAFTRISDDLQNTLMDMRLIPVKTVFQKIPRIIRDIARKTGKSINFQMIGEHTQIDKSIIEVLGDPLVHIIRNSCDHGIESKEKRLACGKPEEGTVILKASHQGGSIAIDIIDDGAGVNTKKVLEIAIDKGLVRPDQVETIDDKTVNNFIFHPGFSTASEVTDLSGRGVGMDVVMTNIQKVHGTVDVDSDPGQGCKVRLTLPLTLSVIEALMVEESGQKFAIPLESVKESIEVKVSKLHQLKNKEAINLRGNVVGVVRLADLLDLKKPAERKPDDVVSIVFIHVGGRAMGIIVDDLSNQQEIVVKPLQGYLSNIPGISGSTILGSGDIILILEPSQLIDLSAQ